MSIIVCKMPKAGLGNQLFPLMKAILQHKRSGFPLIITNYNQFLIGPYLRREKSKRRYQKYFIFQKNLISEWIESLRIKFYKGYKVLFEYSLNEPVAIGNDKYMFVYSALPHWDDYFKELKDHRDIIIKSFFDILSPAILKSASKLKPPVIGVHIRMGDFRKLKAGEDFAKTGTTRTPEKYFVEIITAIRKIAGKNLPVTVFTDGYRHEFTELFELPSVIIMEGNSDIVDLILLSKSKIIITSATSTFSYWAGFLSEAVLIMHPAHIHEPVRSAEFNKTWFEGCLTFENEDPLLLKNVKAISGLQV